LIEFQIVKNPRSKRVRIKVDLNSNVIVTAPPKISNSACEKFVSEHTEWIKAALQKVSARREELRGHKEKLEGKIHYLGRVCELRIDASIKSSHLIDGNIITLKQDKTEHFLRSEARRIIESRCAEIAPFYGVEYKKIRIGFAKSRWGSCSVSGTLSFNAHLIKAPQSIIEYVIIHEICHILQPNHSTHYWNEVAKLCPDYKARRKWLKSEGALLQI